MAPIKSRVTQEIANAYPEWSRVRQDDQSIGKSLLNAIANNLELLVTEIYRGFDNLYLTTAFVGEIDQIYKVALPNEFDFTVDNSNNISPVIVSPTISGLVNSSWVSVTEVPNSSIRNFWYDAVPNRISEVTTFSQTNLIAQGTSDDPYLTITTSGLQVANRLTVIVDSDNRLVSVDINNNVVRSKVRITGITWKDTEETEDVIFLYAGTKQTFKAWKSITSIQPVGFVSTSDISVYTYQFNQANYIDTFTTISQFPESRENLPYFWALTTTEAGYSALEIQRYTSEKAIELLAIKPVFGTYKRMELITSDSIELSLNDIAVVPYQKKVYGIDDTNLYVFDNQEELPDLTVLNSKTPGALIDIQVSSDYCSRSDDLEVSLLFQRPIKTIIRHKFKIQFPDGTEYGVLSDGTLVSTSQDYNIYGEISDRFIRPSLFVNLDEIGQYNLTLECEYFDTSVDVAQRAVMVLAKEPLVTLDLSGLMTQAVGIDIDHLNRLLVLDSDGVIHHIQPHYDLCLIDTLNKEILLRENYSSVKVIK